VEQIVLRSLAKKPEERFQNATDLAHALAECALSGRWNRDDARRWWLSISETAPALGEPALA
jgi:serine/threonine-protein kinase